MAMSDSKFVELCIPDSLRLAKHQDAALVNLAIATTLIAYRKAIRDNVWEKNQAADIARAIAGFMESAYVPHISQEEEDWGKLQLEAEEARVMKASATELAAKPEEAAPEASEVIPAPMAESSEPIKVKVKPINEGDDFGTYSVSPAKGTMVDVQATISCHLMEYGPHEGQWWGSLTSRYDNGVIPVSAPTRKGAIEALLSKAGYKLSAMPKFAEQVDAKSFGSSVGTNVEGIASVELP